MKPDLVTTWFLFFCPYNNTSMMPNHKGSIDLFMDEGLAKEANKAS